MSELNLSEIKVIIKEVFDNSLDNMNIKGLSRRLIENQFEMYLDDKSNDLDIELSFYRMLKILKNHKINTF